MKAAAILSRSLPLSPRIPFWGKVGFLLILFSPFLYGPGGAVALLSAAAMTRVFPRRRALWIFLYVAGCALTAQNQFLFFPHADVTERLISLGGICVFYLGIHWSLRRGFVWRLRWLLGLGAVLVALFMVAPDPWSRVALQGFITSWAFNFFPLALMGSHRPDFIGLSQFIYAPWNFPAPLFRSPTRLEQAVCETPADQERALEKTLANLLRILPFSALVSLVIFLATKSDFSWNHWTDALYFRLREPSILTLSSRMEGDLGGRYALSFLLVALKSVLGAFYTFILATGVGALFGFSFDYPLSLQRMRTFAGISRSVFHFYNQALTSIFTHRIRARLPDFIRHDSTLLSLTLLYGTIMIGSSMGNTVQDILVGGRIKSISWLAIAALKEIPYLFLLATVSYLSRNREKNGPVVPQGPRLWLQVFLSMMMLGLLFSMRHKLLVWVSWREYSQIWLEMLRFLGGR